MRREVEELEEIVNEMCELKSKACRINDCFDRNKVGLIKKIILSTSTQDL